MFDWIWNLHQERWLDAAASDARRAGIAANERLQALEREVDRLSLTCNALWSLLRERTGLTDSYLADRVGQIDQHALRGAAAAQRTCRACGRSFRADRAWCLYCGVEESDAGGPRP